MKTFLEIAKTTGFLKESNNQNKSGDFMLAEGTSGGKLNQMQFDLIEANKDRKPGEHGVGKDGKEFKDIVVLSASANGFRFVQKTSSKIELNEWSRTSNSAVSFMLSSADLKYIK